MDAANHPVFAQLTAGETTAFARHNLLHELEQRLETCPRKRALSAKVHAVVERGVPYFSPTDKHYLAWAAQVAALWAAVETA